MPIGKSAATHLGRCTPVLVHYVGRSGISVNVEVTRQGGGSEPSNSIEADMSNVPSTSLIPVASSSGSRVAPNLTMQIILRRDLVTEHKWPIGPMIAQSAHAATAVLHLNADHPDVKSYLKDWEGMRKAVLEIPDEAALRGFAARLDGLVPRIPYHLWIEQPENIPTALALVPNRRPKALKKLLDGAGCTLWE